MQRFAMGVMGLLLCTGVLSCTTPLRTQRRTTSKLNPKDLQGPTDTTDSSLYQPTKRQRRKGFWCTYRYSRWRVTGIKLRSRPNAPVFATINTYGSPAKTFLRFSKRGPKKGVYLSLNARGVKIRGWAVGSRGVPLYVNRPTRFGENVIAGRYARLHWRGYENKTIALELDTGSSYQANERLLATLPCNQTSMISKPVKELHKLANLPKPTQYINLKKNVRIPVSVTPEGEPVGYIQPARYHRSVGWYQKRGDFVHIFANLGGFSVHGWVPASKTQTPKPSQKAGVLGMLMGVGGLGFRGKRKPTYKRYAQYICRDSVPLLVWNGRRLSRVGHLRKRIPLALIHRNTRWATIQLRWWRSWIKLSRPFRWVIPSQKLNNCRLIKKR